MNKKNKPRLSETHTTTIITSIIGVIGTIVTAYFAFLGVKIQIETQKQSSQVTTQSPPPSVTQSMKQATFTPTTSNENILRIDLEPGLPIGDQCALPFVLPENIDPSKDVVASRTLYNKAAREGEIKLWDRSPLHAHGGLLLLQVTNTGSNQEWVRLSNTIIASIVTKKVPDKVNIISECAGGGYKREFPPIALDPTYQEYKETTSYPNVDYFTLEPGEFETFMLEFTCKAPGLYQTSIFIDYSIGSETGTISKQLPNLVCPKIAANWDTIGRDDKFSRKGIFEWKDTQYIYTAP